MSEDYKPARSASDYYPPFDMLPHFTQDARRKSVEFERICELQRTDSTVCTFIEAWRQGRYQSFEDMMCKLAVQLATEKAAIRKDCREPSPENE